MADEKDKVSGRTIAVGALAGTTAIGIWKLIDALKAKAAPPEGAVICYPDDQTKEAIATALGLLAEIAIKLDNLGIIVDRLDLISDYLREISPDLAEYRFRITDTETNLAIPGKTTKQLYATTAPDKGAIARVKLISNGKDIQYDLYIDNQRWSFNVSDMVDQSIEHPHFPGAWIEKATGDRFVFIFSAGDSMQVRYWNNFSLVARTTTTTAVTILEGQIVEKIFVV